MVEEKFWNKKYLEGGISGLGSIGQYRNWKWKVIEETVGAIRYKSIIDVGCGDMSFWQYGLFNRLRKCKDYFGIDVSEDIINKNIIKYPDRIFFHGNAKDFILIESEIVLALDILFHIMNDSDFEEILLRLCDYSSEWIIIYNWIDNPFKEKGEISDHISQYYRNLMLYDDVFISNNFNLKKVVKCPYDPYGALYFYREMIY